MTCGEKTQRAAGDNIYTYIFVSRRYKCTLQWAVRGCQELSGTYFELSELQLYTKKDWQ